jgi:mycofactocin system glycosyltransferase
MLQRHYALSPRSHLEASQGARRLRCDHPLLSIALNESAWHLLAALRPGLPLDRVATGVTAQTVDFLDELVLRGALQADYRLQPARELPPVDVVLPAYGNADALQRCLAALAQQSYPRERLRVTVVDDATPQPVQARVAAPAGLTLRWLRLAENRGPASARNAGAFTAWPDGAPHAPWLAFLDSDCVPAPHWLAGLAALLEDPFVAAVGGGVRGLSRAGLLARYEDACSSLSLGPLPGPVGLPQGALAYLPSCNLAIDRDVYERSGGFREGWRFGEDVDLSWRLRAAGHRLFYHPTPALAHEHRTRWVPFLQRRRAYGRSEAALHRAHPGRIAPVLQPGPVALLIGAGLALWAGWGVTGATVAGCALLGMAAAPALRALRAETSEGGWPLRVLAVAGARRAAAHLLQQARRLNRQALLLWLPVLAVAPALLPLGVAVFAAGALGEWLARRPALGPGTFLVGYAGECLAYSLGRIEGLLVQTWRRAWLGAAQPAAGATNDRKSRDRDRP